MKSDWEKVGIIGVDAGICWIGDPCYIMHKEEPYKDVGKDWGDFCDLLWKKGEDKENPLASPRHVQFNYDGGHPGLGVCVSSGYGDGSYEVFVKKTSDGRIAEAKVVFIPDNEEIYDDEEEF